MKKLAIALALVAVFGLNVSAQDCGGGVCTAGTMVKKQDEAKKGSCSSEAKLASKPQDEKKAPKTDEVIKRGACHGELSSGCSDLDAYLAAEKAAGKGCATSKAKLASMTKANPKLPEIATLYKNACNGCETSAAKLAAMKKAAPQEEPKAKSDCGSTCESGAKVVKAEAKGDCGSACDAATVVKGATKSDCCGDAAKAKLAKAGEAKSDCGSSCQDEGAKVVKAEAKKGSGCDTLDAYLASEKAAAKGCETSKAKLAAMTKANPKLADMAKLYKNACNGCESSKAKLAEMQKAVQKTDAKSDCGSSCGDAAPAKVIKTDKGDCGSSCETGAKVVKAEAKGDCCGDAAGAKLAKAADCGSACETGAKVVKADAKADCGSSCETGAKVVKAEAKKGSGCDTLDAYLASEKAAAKGCETSKAKLAAMTKANPKLADMAKLYKNACNGCESSKAKLAEMQKAVQKTDAKSDCGSSCEGTAPAKTIKAAKSDCGSSCEGEGKLIEKKAEIKKSECQDACGDACGDACEEGKTIGAKKATKVIKAECCPATERKVEPKSAMKDL